MTIPPAEKALKPRFGVLRTIALYKLVKVVLLLAVAYGELGFAAALPATGQAAQEIAALLAELRALDWLPMSATTPTYV